MRPLNSRGEWTSEPVVWRRTVREPPPTQAGVGLLCLPTALQKKVFCIDFWKPHALLASETRRSQGCRAPWLLRAVGDWTRGRPFVREGAPDAHLSKHAGRR